MTKETISRYLENGCKGHKNVVSSRELERALGISGNELRRHINRLRRGTVPIAADQRGYYPIQSGQIFLGLELFSPFHG